MTASKRKGRRWVLGLMYENTIQVPS